MTSQPTLIPIASGKGGVGKSFLAANLAVALAEAGRDTIIADLDLGGSNIYGFLGLPNRYAGIGDFLKARTAELDQLLVPTDIARLTYLPGDGKTPFMANIPHAQKVRLISRLKKLPAEIVLLDLSAGSTFNTIDFFRMSLLGMVVTVPEYPAIMNLLTFLKLTLTRIIERIFIKNDEIRRLLKESHQRPLDRLPAGIEDLKKAIAAIDPGAETVIDNLCLHFRPRLVFNMGEHPEEMGIHRRIDEGLASVLSLKADYFGFVFRDAMVRRSINARAPHLIQYPDSPTSKTIRKIAERMTKYWKKPVDGSARRIMAQAEQTFREDIKPLG